MTFDEIWLRYYADEALREEIRTDDPGAVLPPHEEPPYDRDRFLPEPPMPLEAHTGWLSGEEGSMEEDGDPLGLDEIEAEPEEDVPGIADPFPVPSDAELEAQLRASEPENWRPPAELLVDKNVPLLPPDELTDETLTPILWELLHNLALRGFYVLHTDHLSDRELYRELWRHGLREPAHFPGRSRSGGWFHDFLGSWGEREMQLWLRFYATNEERAKHAGEWPEDKIPPKEKCPFNRDWRLPKGPF